VEADLRTRKVITSVTIDAPGDGRPVTRVNWLLRQLKDAPESLVLEASFVSSQATNASLLSVARENPSDLLLSNDPKRPPRSFRLAFSRTMGSKRGKGERSFVLETRKQANDFYRDLVQNLRPWRPSAPKLPDEPEEEAASPLDETASVAPEGYKPTAPESRGTSGG